MTSATTPASLLRCLATAGTLGLALLGAARGHELRVEVVNAASDQGPVTAALYTDAAQWLKTPFQGKRQAPASPTVLVYRDLPPGRYAVSLFQDANGNGRFDRNPIGMPVEPYGFSRDALGTMGPPSFSDASIDLRADTTITITLR